MGCTGFNLNKRKPNIFKRKLNRFVCDHSRSIYFYLEEKDADSTCQKIAYSCESYKKFKSGLCNDCGIDNNKCRQFEYEDSSPIDATFISNYSFYLDTNGEFPFCRHHYSLEIEIESSKLRNDHFDLLVNGVNDKDVFEIKANWSNSTFTTLLTTDKELGQLVSSMVILKNRFLFGNKEIKFKSLSLYYMSNFDAKIRDELSAGMLVKSSYGGIYAFDVV